MQNCFCRRSIGLIAACFFAVTSSKAGVNDVFPGDYYPADPGTSTLTLYAFDRLSVGPYARGNKLLDGKLSARIGALRATRAYQVGGLSVAPVGVITWLDADTSPVRLSNAMGRDTRGAGDLRLGVTVWPINDRENANYLGLTAMISAPTGSYDSNQRLNPGENRWRFILSGGWQKDITPRVLIELMPEIAFYGDNGDYAGGNRLEQAPSLALTSYLRWRLTPAWHAHLGAQFNAGGEIRLNGVDQDNPPETTRISAGMSWFLPQKQQLILRFSEESAVANGFRMDRDIALRYQKSF
jgi:hypothetical protein